MSNLPREQTNLSPCINIDFVAVAEEPPKNIFEASEQGVVGWIVKAVERTLDYDINQRDRLLRTGLHWWEHNGAAWRVAAWDMMPS